jgi:BMFP domain-containing protein YqiC
MSNNKNFLDEINKLAGTAYTSAVQAKDSFIDLIKQHVESFMQSHKLVSRDEFEALKEIVMKSQKTTKKKNNTKVKSQVKKVVKKSDK